jgi:2-amino-4-hydroxy-6-hydroxymethyldihydropteridine diphosphokinase
MKVWLSLGSNLGKPFQELERAIKYLNEKCYISVLQVSEAIETKPFGVADQPDFANQVIQIETPLSAHELLIFLKETERHLGRTSGQAWGPRLIDLDILFYGDEVIKTQELTIPHPAILDREYLLRLLNSIIPEYLHPETKKTINDMYNKFKSKGGAE